jgi:lambda family phage minor tail protein L
MAQPTADVQSYSPGSLIILYELDATSVGGSITRFHDGTNELSDNITWNTFEYNAFPIKAEGFSMKSRGQLPRPTLTVSNADSIMAELVDAYNDLIGAKLTRIRTFSKYLDAVNFEGGSNPTADPTIKFDDDIYYISRKILHNNKVIQFEMTAPNDVIGVKLPRRQAMQNVCTWVYRSAECSYAGGAVADINDLATSDLNVDACGKRLESCKLRFGETAALPYGGFPGLGRLR